jgi:hypothetical protein
MVDSAVCGATISSARLALEGRSGGMWNVGIAFLVGVVAYGFNKKGLLRISLLRSKHAL